MKPNLKHVMRWLVPTKHRRAISQAGRKGKRVRCDRVGLECSGGSRRRVGWVEECLRVYSLRGSTIGYD